MFNCNIIVILALWSYLVILSHSYSGINFYRLKKLVSNKDINVVKKQGCNNILHQPSYNKLCMSNMREREVRPLNDVPMELCDENVLKVIDEVRSELGTLFGYDAGSRAVGITGEIDLVEIDGPVIAISLKGGSRRFWHATDTVMLRVESFIRQRLPEVLEIQLDMNKSNIVDDNRLNSEGGPKKLF